MPLDVFHFRYQGEHLVPAAASIIGDGNIRCFDDSSQKTAETLVVGCGNDGFGAVYVVPSENLPTKGEAAAMNLEEFEERVVRSATASTALQPGEAMGARYRHSDGSNMVLIVRNLGEHALAREFN
jgi:hypothetical protein